MVVGPNVDPLVVLIVIVPAAPTATTSELSPTTPFNCPYVPVTDADDQPIPVVDVLIPEVLPTATNTPSEI